MRRIELILKEKTEQMKNNKKCISQMRNASMQEIVF